MMKDTTVICEECFKSFDIELIDYNSDEPITCQNCLDIAQETLDKETQDGQDSEQRLP